MNPDSFTAVRVHIFYVGDAVLAEGIGHNHGIVVLVVV